MSSTKATKADPSSGANTSRLGMSESKKLNSNASVGNLGSKDIKKPSFGLKRPTTAVGSTNAQPASKAAPSVSGLAKSSVTTAGGLKRPTKVENRASVPQP